MLNVSVGWRKVTVDIDGSKITAEIRPLKVADAMNLTAVAEDSTLSDSQRGFKLLETIGGRFVDYIRNVEGLQVDGEPVSPAMLAEETALSEVAIKLVIEIMSASKLSGGDAKNSDGQPAPDGV